MNDKTIPFSDNTRYLGVELTKDLNWSRHINQKIGAAKRLLMAVGGAIGKAWGPSPRLTKWAYTGMVRPIVTYGCHVLAQAAVGGKWETKLQRLNRLAAKMLAPFRRSTPTAGLEVVAHLMPLDLCFLQESIMTYHRIKNLVTPQWDGLPTTGSTRGHMRWLKDWSDQHGMQVAEVGDQITPTLSWEKRYTVALDSFKDGSPNRKRGGDRIYRRLQTGRLSRIRFLHR